MGNLWGHDLVSWPMNLFIDPVGSVVVNRTVKWTRMFESVAL